MARKDDNDSVDVMACLAGVQDSAVDLYASTAFSPLCFSSGMAVPEGVSD